MSKEMVKWQQKQRSLGKCRVCAKPVCERSRTFCEYHLEQKRISQREYRNKRRAVKRQGAVEDRFNSFAHWYYDKYNDGSLFQDVEDYLSQTRKGTND